jgi:hypothetical protein
VRAWQEWLERHDLTQPFKQAHREVYLITDAELRTRTYSNRFAGHILRQHQFQALCDARGWRYTLGTGRRGPTCATLELPSGLRAEFWIEAASGPAADLSPAGIALYTATDRVQFVPQGAGAPFSLSAVPAEEFTEVMRDVDLFVGVASVGNDPTWYDRGPAPYRTYWETFAFGDLSASAVTRRSVLERLLPRLSIAARCELADRFLVVRGDLRTYRIHLGSGNILMEPGSRYLCIVPDRTDESATAGLALPFEGDGMLSIILSKALLLAADTRITDPTITRQIAGR